MLFDPLVPFSIFLLLLYMHLFDHIIIIISTHFRGRVTDNDEDMLTLLISLIGCVSWWVLLRFRYSWVSIVVHIYERLLWRWSKNVHVFFGVNQMLWKKLGLLPILFNPRFGAFLLLVSVFRIYEDSWPRNCRGFFLHILVSQFTPELFILMLWQSLDLASISVWEFMVWHVRFCSYRW